MIAACTGALRTNCGGRDGAIACAIASVTAIGGTRRAWFMVDDVGDVALMVTGRRTDRARFDRTRNSTAVEGGGYSRVHARYRTAPPPAAEEVKVKVKSHDATLLLWIG